jgi:hypothetical protein
MALRASSLGSSLKACITRHLLARAKTYTFYPKWWLPV